MCQDTGCCKNDAFTCFSRLNGKASCEKDRDICLSKGANKGEEWECEELEPVAYSPFPRCDAAWVGGSLLAAAAAPGALPGLSAADLDAAGLPDVFAVAGTGAVVAT